MSLMSYLQRRQSAEGVWRRRAVAPVDAVDTADPDDDLASGRFSRHASSEEFLDSLKKRT